MFQIGGKSIIHNAASQGHQSAIFHVAQSKVADKLIVAEGKNTIKCKSKFKRSLIMAAKGISQCSPKTCVVVIYCNIFLPLLLTILSVVLVPLLTLSCVTVPPPPHPLATICQYGYPRDSPPPP